MSQAATAEPLVCQVCGEALDGRREAVSCSRCSTPHHLDCWSFAGGCSTFACGSAHAVPGVGVQDSAGSVLRIGGLGDGSVDGVPVRLPVAARPRTFVPQVGDASLAPASRYTRLDLDTPLETGLRWAALVALACSVVGLPGVGRGFDWRVLGLLWPLAGAFMLARMLVDCTYVMDNVSRQLLYARSLFGLTQTWAVCRFEQVSQVGIVGRVSSSEASTRWIYGVVLELPGRVRVQVSGDTSDHAQAYGLAQRLAKHLGAALLPSHPATRGTPPGDWFPPRADDVSRDLVPVGPGRAGKGDFVLFVLTALLSLLALVRPVWFSW